MEAEKGIQNSAHRSDRKKSGKGVLKGLISGTFLTEKLILNNIRYALLLAALGIIFIANKFGAERMQRQITVLEQEVRDLRAESLTVSAELGGVSRQSEIIDLVKERGLGLEELREPPFRIVVNE
jgi:cell division protein FtsL